MGSYKYIFVLYSPLNVTALKEKRYFTILFLIVTQCWGKCCRCFDGTYYFTLHSQILETETPCISKTQAISPTSTSCNYSKTKLKSTINHSKVMQTCINLSLLISEYAKIRFNSFNIELSYNTSFGYMILTRGGWWEIDTVKTRISSTLPYTRLLSISSVQPEKLIKFQIT